MDINDYKGLTNAQIALICAKDIAVATIGQGDGYWDEEDVLFAARKFKKFLNDVYENEYEQL